MIPKNLHENIAFLIGEASHLFYNKVSRTFREKKLNVTIEQFSILTILWYQNGLSQQEIANRLNRDKTTLTRVINNMEKSNLVIRVPDKMDRRINHIYLTYLGKELQETLTEATGKIYLDSIREISGEELHQFAEILNRVIRNLK
jgi:DNA-binding MarR family transcriptional regulator